MEFYFVTFQEWKVLEICSNQTIKFYGFTKKIFPMARRIDLRMLGMKGYVVKLKPWKNQSES